MMNNSVFLARKRLRKTLKPRKGGKKWPKMGLRKCGELMPSIPPPANPRPQTLRPSTTLPPRPKRRISTTQLQEEPSAAAVAAEGSTLATEDSTQTLQGLLHNSNQNNSKQPQNHHRLSTRLKVPRVRGCVPVAQGRPTTSWKLAHPS